MPVGRERLPLKELELRALGSSGEDVRDEAVTRVTRRRHRPSRPAATRASAGARERPRARVSFRFERRYGSNGTRSRFLTSIAGPRRSDRNPSGPFGGRDPLAVHAEPRGERAFEPARRREVREAQESVFVSANRAGWSKPRSSIFTVVARATPETRRPRARTAGVAERPVWASGRAPRGRRVAVRLADDGEDAVRARQACRGRRRALRRRAKMPAISSDAAVKKGSFSLFFLSAAPTSVIARSGERRVRVLSRREACRPSEGQDAVRRSPSGTNSSRNVV